MSDFDAINLAKIRYDWENPYPWKIEPKYGFYEIELAHFSFIEPAALPVLDQFPVNIRRTIDTIVAYRLNPNHKHPIDIGNLREKLEDANLPWIRNVERNEIYDSNGRTLIVGETDAVGKIHSGFSDMAQMLDIIERYARSEKTCQCGHERSSHLFMTDIRCCVQRPCGCQHFLVG